MIITRQKKVPWSWVVLTHMPWAAMLFASVIGSLVFTLELRKFTANPLTISLLLTINGFIWTFVNPITHFLSDRIWTRFGRRKIFYVPSVAMQILLIIIIPYLPNLTLLLSGFLIYTVFVVTSQPKESLAQEVVPNSQRGRASVMHSIFVQIGLFTYSIALIGRFDDVYYTQPFQHFVDSLTGEKLIFWVCAVALMMVVLIVGLGIKEIKPAKRLHLKEDLGGKVTPWRFFKRLFVSCFSADFWPIYLLGFSKSMYALNLGPMVVLMYTEQWGYSTQDMGTNQAIMFVATAMVLCTGVAFIDKYNRLKSYAFLIGLGMMLKIFWYLFVLFIAPEQRPALWQILVFGEGIQLIGHIVSMVMYPLQYEYIPSNKFGTANAGMAIFLGGVGLITGPLMGLWIYNYSKIFHPGPGSEVVLVSQNLISTQDAQQMKQRLVTASGEEFDVSIYKPFGASADKGRQWKVRQIDQSAEAIRKENETLANEIKTLKGRIAAKTIAHDNAAVTQLTKENAVVQANYDANKALLQSKVNELKTFLTNSSGVELPNPSDSVRALALDDTHAQALLAVTYPLNQKDLERVQKEILIAMEDYGWERIEIENRTDDKTPLLEVNAFRSARLDDAPVDPEISAVIAQAAKRLDLAPLDSNGRNDLALLVQSTARVIGGYRSNFEIPFPEGDFKPQKFDYFSAYLMMILTDFVGLWCIWFLWDREKKGKITRWGALEQAAAAKAEAK